MIGKEISKFKPHWACAILISLVALASARCLFATSLYVTVREASGQVVEGALVYAMPLPDTVRKSKEPITVAIDQVDKEFVDHVTIVQLGTKVYFPNRDKIRHHVYSFSPAKKFELPLYGGTPADPIVFDKEGVVVLGCNIHDWMQAYVYVIDTPYFNTSGKDGKTLLEVPPGNYDVRIWHPQLAMATGQTSSSIALSEGEKMEKSFIIGLKQAWKPRRGPVTGHFSAGGYR